VVVVETSALLAILQEEPEASRFLDVIDNEQCVVSAATVYEAAIVINARRGAQGVVNLLEYIEAAGFSVSPFAADMIDGAVAAYQTYGRGSGSKARLNFGDCISYALAKSLDAPLLFKGDDFAATDIRSAA
jgi:ribonuclease VapC